MTRPALALLFAAALDFDRMVERLVAVLQKLDAPTVARIRDFTPQ